MSEALKNHCNTVTASVPIYFLCMEKSKQEHSAKYLHFCFMKKERMSERNVILFFSKLSL